MLDTVSTETYSFFAPDSLLIFYLALVTTKLAYASILWNSITSTDAKKLASIQLKFVALSQYRFFTHDHVIYEDFLKFLKRPSLHSRRIYLDALFLISVCWGLKCCPSLFVITGIREILLNFRNSSLFTATCNNNCPLARCVSAANHVCEGVDILRKTTKFLKHFLCQSVSLLYEIIFSGLSAFAFELYINFPTIMFFLVLFI
jgi:hypothetical protein